ncbi:MAG: alpha/beta hydrolase fold protein, partial [Nocardioides sp.]|nr:alpha/beta hydrolase fold protein [Nocardioides sp.]
MSVPLPPFPRPLPELVADPARVADAGTELLAVSARLDDAGELARAEGLLAGWLGEAADAYRHDLAPYGARADAMSLALRRVGQRVEDHAHALRRLLAELDELTEGNRVLVDEVLAHADAVRALEARDPADPGRRQTEVLLHSRSHELAGRVRALDVRQVDWWERVVAEEAAVLDAFAAVLEPSQVEHHHGGQKDPADDALRCFPGRAAGPLAALAWWRGLSELQRRAVLAAAPGAVGDLDGIPSADRDRANRVRLSRDLATLRHLEDLGRLTDHERGTLDNAEAVEEALDRHADDTDAHGRPVPTLLWVYDPGAFVQPDGDVDGRVAIAVGDPDTADSTAVNVPGVGTDAGDVGLHTDRSWELHQAATVADPDRSYASIAWLGYDAPPDVTGRGDLEAAASAAAAAHGGALLA